MLPWKVRGQMMTNGISEILGVSSPPILPCFRATTCRQHACTLVTQHRTPMTLPHPDTGPEVDGARLWATHADGADKSCVAWKTSLKELDNIPQAHRCPRPKSPDLATAREKMWCRQKPLGETVTCADSLEPGTVCPPSEALSAGEMGKQPGPCRWGVVQPGRWHATPDFSLSGALSRDSGGWAPRDGPSWAPRVSTTHSPVPLPQALQGEGKHKNSHGASGVSHTFDCV